MGRTLKRVPLDFDWPLKKIWKGYINPYVKLRVPCQGCEKSGLSPRALVFQKQWYGTAPFDPRAYGARPLAPDHPQIVALAERHVAESPEYYGRGKDGVQRESVRLWNLWRHQWAHNLVQDDVDALIVADRLWDFTRVPRTPEQAEIVRQKVADGGNSWLPESNGYVPTADEVNAWSMGGFGHDGSNAWICLRARCKREGVELECGDCAGHGYLWPTPDLEQKCDEWQKEEPPTGEGYQLWETTSEGAPISPVFQSMDELCRYAAERCTTFGSFTATAEQWREMLDEDLVHHRDGDSIFM